MSIINEALKKAQVNLELRKSPTPSKPRENGKKERNVGLWILSFLIFAGFIGCVIVFVILIFSRHQPLAPLPKDYSLPSESQRLQEILEKTKTSPLKNPKGTLILNGIISMGDDPIALINNQIFHTGDYVEDKRILSISKDKVEIFDKGKILILKTQ